MTVVLVALMLAITYGFLSFKMTFNRDLILESQARLFGRLNVVKSYQDVILDQLNDVRDVVGKIRRWQDADARSCRDSFMVIANQIDDLHNLTIRGVNELGKFVETRANATDAFTAVDTNDILTAIDLLQVRVNDVRREFNYLAPETAAEVIRAQEVQKSKEKFLATEPEVIGKSPLSAKKSKKTSKK